MYTGRMPCEGEGGDLGGVFISQKIPKIQPAHHQTLGEKPVTAPPSRASEGSDPANVSLSDFWPPEL